MKRLEQAVADLADTPPTTRSGLERASLAFCAAHHLPKPVTNIVVEGFEVDAHWPGTNIVVELDGREFHGTPQAFERDRRRDRALAVAGYVVIRVTAKQLGPELAADLRVLIRRRGRTGSRA